MTKFNTEVDHVVWLLDQTPYSSVWSDCAGEAVRNLKHVHEEEMSERPAMLGDIGALPPERSRTFPLICMIKALREAQPQLSLKEAKDIIVHMVVSIRQYAMQHGDRSYY